MGEHYQTIGSPPPNHNIFYSANVWSALEYLRCKMKKGHPAYKHMCKYVWLTLIRYAENQSY